MNYGLSLYTAPATEPLSTTEAKLHLRVDHSDEDTLIANLIEAARQTIEERTGRALITQTWALSLDTLPYGERELFLPRPPLQSVTHLKYYDTDGNQQTWTNTNYIVSTSYQPGRLSLAYNISWPSIQYRVDAIDIRYVAGYGAASAIPEGLRQAMLLLVGHWYTNREAVVIGTITAELPLAVESLIRQYIVGDEFTCYAPAA